MGCKIYNECLDAGKSMYIHEVFDAMQTVFAVDNHWRPECMWTHDTRNLMFKKCKRKKKVRAVDMVLIEEEAKESNVLEDEDESIAAPQMHHANTASMMSDIQMLE